MRHRRADTRRLIKQSTPLKAGSSALAAMLDVNKASRWTENGVWLLIKRQKPPFTHAAWDQTKTTKKVKDAQKKTNPITHLFIPLFRQEPITNSSPTVVWMLCKITSLVKKKNGMAIYNFLGPPLEFSVTGHEKHCLSQLVQIKTHLFKTSQSS